jgi:phage regulator Rha-like protein
MSGLSVSEHDGVLVVDSRLIAPRLSIEHINYLETVETYQTQIEQAFGIIRFETEKTGKRGRPQKYALLTEDQASVSMTFSRNTPDVVQCKIDLVLAFSKAKDLLRQRQPKPAYVPYWYERMKIALSSTENPLQVGYFCVYREMMAFFCEMETRLGYLVPDVNPITSEHLVPDISIGSRFNTFLRSEDELPSLARLQFLGSTEAIDFRPTRSSKRVF